MMRARLPFGPEVRYASLFQPVVFLIAAVRRQCAISPSSGVTYIDGKDWLIENCVTNGFLQISA